MRVNVIPGNSLDSALVGAWNELRQSNPELASPCFAPEFTRAVAAARQDVEVGIVREGGEVVAFFPFQRRGNSRGIPVGGIVSDYQGLVCRPGFTCDPRELLRECRLVAWDFDRLLASQAFLAPFHEFCEPSALMDLSGGFETYAAGLRASGSKQIKKCRNLMRRIEREMGPMRYVSHSTDLELLNQVLAWKSEQYRKSGWRDLFALSWGRALVERILASQNEGCAGRLSLLFAGNRLVAGHMGMRSQTVWHYWFPAYQPEFAKYSPGLILLLKMAEEAPALGLRTIDLGTGISLYKERLMNASVSVAEGSVERISPLWLRRTARRKLRSLVAPMRRLLQRARGL